jgi:RNA methyltransferase, TrmH family
MSFLIEANKVPDFTPMVMITSTSNPRIKYVRNLQNQVRARREDSVFVIEGVRLAEEAAAANWPASLVLFTQDLSSRGMAVIEHYQTMGVEVIQVAAHVLSAVSDTQNPQGILIILHQYQLPIPEHLDFVLILDGIRDPGNLGTMLRSAAAAGVQGVWLAPDTVDPFAPKVLRAGMGAHFHLPLTIMDWAEIATWVVRYQLHMFIATTDASSDYDQVNLRQPCALLIGGEAFGPGQQALALPHTKVRIPMQTGSESLNAAVAAGILMFETQRQRRL